MSLISVVILMCLTCVVFGKPVDDSESQISTLNQSARSVPRIWKRFVDFSMRMDTIADVDADKHRTKRSAEECEKLQLCLLHAESGHSFVASFELYFVNKEKARLWDHRTHTAAECEEMFSGCHSDGGAHAHKQEKKPTTEAVKEEQVEVEQKEQDTEVVEDDYER